MNERWHRLAKRLTGVLAEREGSPGDCPRPPAPEVWFDFDALVKDLAGGLSRREALRRLGGGLTGALLAAVGMGETWAAPGGNSACAHWCKGIFPPGPAPGQCTNDAAYGLGLCPGCGPAAPAGHPDLCGQYGGPRFCCTAALPDCCGLTCVQKQTDVNHCGACGNICPQRPHATPTCVAGQCGYSCDAGYDDCNASAADGCETHLLTDIGHCGQCGHECLSPANAIALCTDGQCGFVCQEAYDNCNGDPADGCEISLLTDVNHCGACGYSCPTLANATPTCSGGQCNYTCHAGFADCNQDAADGCEINLVTDLANCGTCGNTCPTPSNATPTCSGGQCSYTCLSGFADCNGGAADGCEISLLTDVNHCGACGQVCLTPANATPTCTNGVCAYTCLSGFADCNGSAADGCETNLRSDAQNCGACGKACGAGETCANGECQCGTGPACGSGQVCSSGVCCPTGQTNCSGTCRNLGSDPSNCGSCGGVCPARANAVAICTSGQCGYTCNPGFGNCDDSAANGCEISLDTDENHCGACGNACGAGEVCDGGACHCGAAHGPVCGPDQVCSDGFCCPKGETACNGTCVDLQTDFFNCGTCFRVCGSGETCAGGACHCGSATGPVCGANQVCSSGICCPTGQTNCSGTCRNLSSDPSHCGACNNSCTAPANATATCANRTCGFACNQGLTNCSGTCVNLQTNSAHCGACGNACAAGETCAGGACHCGSATGPVCGANQVCSNGQCVCASGLTNCSGTCVSLSSDPSHCGRCGNDCLAFSDDLAPNCCGGECVNVRFNIQHCGTCGNACPAGAGCSNGQCVCPAGQTICGASCVNLQTNSANCGACGHICTGGSSCVNGQCRCPSGQFLCDGVCTDLNTTSNCGSCGRACAAGENCCNGQCQGCPCGQTECVPTAGWGRGDPVCVDLLTDDSHCGACNGNCTGLPGTDPKCCNGQCVNLHTDESNCGKCGVVCTNDKVCVTGQCVCPAGRVVCNLFGDGPTICCPVSKVCILDKCV